MVLGLLHQILRNLSLCRSVPRVYKRPTSVFWSHVVPSLLMIQCSIISPVSAGGEHNDATSAGHSALVVELTHHSHLVGSDLQKLQFVHANLVDQIMGMQLDRLNFSDLVTDTLKTSKKAQCILSLIHI